jgi:hypothetical protein
VVVDGAQLTSLLGSDPAELVAFRREARGRRLPDRWRQIPVQVDERTFVDFGLVPDRNGEPGSEGTVYGTVPSGHGVLAYADPQTFVGADPDPTLDLDDEVALIAGDAGNRAEPGTRRPRGVWGLGAIRLRLVDPLGGEPRFVYLYRSQGARTSPAGADYVEYDFALRSGDYRSTYKRADGPNPESSSISTAAYAAGFTDRWYFDQLSIRAGGANAVDVLDGFKFSFGPTSCGRSEATFNEAEGAFVANLDGPVRAIRSYVGANSGPFTQRTHLFYPDRHQIVTDLRVHPVPGPLIYHDLSAAGTGMTYVNSVGAGAVTVDGSQDSVPQAPAAWHLWSGPQGALFSADRIDSSFADALNANASNWYLDDLTPEPYLQCWGDDAALGQAGFRSTSPMPDTDPRGGAADHLRGTTTEILSGPGTTVEQATRWSAELDAPLDVVVRARRHP